MSEQFNKIELYVAGSMAKEERVLFEKLMDEDPNLRNEVEQYRIIQEALEQEVEKDLRIHLNALMHADKHKSPPRVIPIWRRPLSIAAALISLAVVTYLLIPRSDSFLASNHIEHVDYSSTRGDQFDSEINDGIQFIKEGKNSEAIDFFSDYITRNEDNMSAQFILGDLFIKTNNISAALKQMAIVIDANSFLWNEKAQINYLILALEHGWDSRAQSIMEDRLKNNDHPHYEIVKKIEQQRKKK